MPRYDFDKEHFGKGMDAMTDAEKNMTKLMAQDDLKKLIAKFRYQPEVLQALAQDLHHHGSEQLRIEQEKRQKAAETAAANPKDWWNQ